MLETKSYPFMLINAFTQDTYGGNPAVVLFVDKILPIETRQKIAQNFNQPITAFVSPDASPTSPSNKSEATFDISWFTNSGSEIWLCGHGTLATAKAVFTYPEMAGKVRQIRLRTRTGEMVTARKIDGDEEWFEFSLSASQLIPLSADETRVMTDLVAKAAGKDSIKVKFAARGGPGFTAHVIIELDEEEDLAGMVIDGEVLVSPSSHEFGLGLNREQRASGYRSNILTTDASSSGDTYHLRMFAPLSGLKEDIVTGSSNCLVAPYWAQKKDLKASEMRVKQVSARGGELKAIWEGDTIKLRGQAKLVGKGEMYL